MQSCFAIGHRNSSRGNNLRINDPNMIRRPEKIKQILEIIHDRELVI